MPKILVIGSGPGAIGTIWGLQKLGISPEVWDAGRQVPAEALKVKSQLQVSNASLSREFIQNAMPKGLDGFPRKAIFGSSYYKQPSGSFFDIVGEAEKLTASYSQGGMSVAWGGAMLPMSQDDLRDWPVPIEDLKQAYQAVMQHIPLATVINRSATDMGFPYYRDKLDHLPLPAQAQAILSHPNSSLDSNGGVHAARLALRLGDEKVKSCVGCGSCLLSCPHDAIYNFADALEEMKAKIDYKSGILVTKLVPSENGVKVISRDGQTGQFLPDQLFDYVFLGAGAVNSTRIIMESLGLFEQDIRMLDSQKFVLPGLSRYRAAKWGYDRTITLPQLFLESRDPDSYWEHAQISGVSPFLMANLPGVLSSNFPILKQFLPHITDRLMTAWCGLNSRYSGGFSLRLLRAQQNGQSLLKVSEVINPKTSVYIRQAAIRFMKKAWGSGLYFVPPALKIAPTGAGCHFGGSLPMMHSPETPWQTETSGALAGLKQVHIVDTSCFPALPATTLALTAAANGYRIGTNLRV